MPTNLKITDLTDLGETPSPGDLFEIIDVSDTTMGGDGTNKKVSYATMIPTFGLLATIPSLDISTTSLTDLFTVPVGFNLVISFVTVVVLSFTNGPAQFSIGSDDPGYIDFCNTLSNEGGISAVNQTLAIDSHFNPASGTGLPPFYPENTVIKVNVSVPAPQTLRFYMFGFLSNT